MAWINHSALAQLAGIMASLNGPQKTYIRVFVLIAILSIFVTVGGTRIEAGKSRRTNQDDDAELYQHYTRARPVKGVSFREYTSKNSFPDPNWRGEDFLEDIKKEHNSVVSVHVYVASYAGIPTATFMH